MTDTDSDMMRRQQNMDTQQTIEGVGDKSAADLDARDGEDRRSALAGRVSGTGSQDSVLSQNTRDGHASHKASAVSSRRLGGLVRKGRSLLGA